MKTGRPPTNGLYRARPRTCPCGVVFVGRRPEATYCSNECRKRFTRYGQSHGHYDQRQFGETK